MPYVPGGDCSVGGAGPVQEQKACDGCFPSKTTSPVVVKILRPINHNVNANRMGYGSRFPSSRGDCCKWCIQKANANQMVFNQNKIVNFDLINRLNEANGISPNLTYTSTPPGGPPGKRKCDNCINILRDKELQLLKKEQEILKIKTHFTNLPKGGGQDGLGTNCEHCFKALREKEFELFRKEQEIAKMKRAAAAQSPLNTQAKVERARCANCFKALRQKELELIKKEHALMKNMTRPNINVKNLNYCSCCRDNKKSSINQMKKQEDLRKKNRDNCFKQLRMKEIRLLAKEREIDKKIQKFREESIAKAKSDLEKTPDPRLIKPTTKEVIKCVCSCTGEPEHITKQKEKAKGICKILYDKFPTSPGAWRGKQVQAVKSQETKLSAKALKERTCTRPCCVMKMASNLAACFLTPPKAKKPKELPEPCRFLKMLSWCSPDQPNKNLLKCCIMPTKLEKQLPIKEQKRIEERITEQKAIALKAAKAAAESGSPYRVDTIGRIRPGKRRPSPGEKLNVVEAEVLRSYGPRGLEAYKTKMAELKIDTEVAQAKLPKPIKSTEELKSKGTKQFPSMVGIKGVAKKGFDKEGIAKQGVATSGVTQSGVAESRIAQSRVAQSRVAQGGPKESREFYAQAVTSADRETKVAGARSEIKRGTFKTKLYDRATRAAKQFKTKAGRPDYFKTGKHVEESGHRPETFYSKEPITPKTIVDADRAGAIKKSKTLFGDKKVSGTPKTMMDDDRIEVPKKHRAKIGSMVEEDRSKVPGKYKRFGRRDDYERELPKRYRTKVDDEDYEVPRTYGSRFGSGDYVDEWKVGSSERMRGPIPWFPSAPACPKYLKIFGQTLVYCAGCFIGIPCILFLCLLFFASSCSD